MATTAERFKNFYRGLDTQRRLQLFVSVGIALVSVIAVGVWASQTPYRPLLTGAPYEELLDAAAALDEREIKYRILDNGTLQVPSHQLGNARAAVAEFTKLPGLTDVGELKLGLTPAAQMWAFLRAREGDLARMVNGISGVSASQINIVPRVQSLFVDEEIPASASVFLKLQPGDEVDAAQVNAIVNLVAHAVEGLSADNITVVDDRGNMLTQSNGADAKGTEETSALLEVKTALERRYEQAVSQALFPVIGYGGGFSVTASVDIDRTSSEVVSKAMDPDKQAITAEDIDESLTEDQEAGGVPGVDANLPERPAQAAGGDTTRTERTKITSSFEYPTKNEVTRRPPGDVKRVSVAVQVDASRVASLAKASERPIEELEAEITRTVEAAVGYDSERNDTVSVQFLPFADKDWVEDATPPAAAFAIEHYLSYGIAALGLVLMFLFVVRPLMTAMTQAPTPEAKEDEEEEEGAGRRKRPVDPDANLAGRLRELVDNYETIDSGDFNRLVDRESVAAAQVLKQWKKGA